MSTPNRSAHVVRVVLAALVVVTLAGLLGIRIAAQSPGMRSRIASEPVAQPYSGIPSPASVPEPAAPPDSGIPVPCWYCPESRSWPVRFRTDLDLLAPLGDGEENAGVWFKDFAKPDGPRFDEAAAAMERRYLHTGGVGSGGRTVVQSGDKVLPADDPLLLEAEPWCDRATMKFYPEFFTPNGYQTQVPNLLLPLTLARSWVARGDDAADGEEAMEDYRRAVRLGRLLRQEDATIISDLVGLYCIRLGADGIYRRALAEGDKDLALVASVVLGEIAPQRLMTSVVTTETDLAGHVSRSFFGGARIEAPDSKVDALIRRARSASDRRFRLEAIVTLSFIHHMGTSEQHSKTAELFEELAGSPDDSISTTARWALETEPNPEQIGWFED
jgi:hypothetical protein